jgi:DNA-binding MarR family transcriptional regulator
MMEFSQKETGEFDNLASVTDTILRGFVGYQMKCAFNTIQSDLNKTLAPYHLRMISFSVLVMIVENSGIRQSQIAEALSIEAPNLVVALDDLERRNLIARKRLITDRRVWLIKATLPGATLCRRAIAAVKAHEENLLADFDGNAIEQLMQTLKKIEAS